MHPFSSERWLRRRLRQASSRFHLRPAVLSDDRQLFDVLLSLYDKSPTDVWHEDIGPFLGSHSDALRLLYEEHRALPEAGVLDLVEALMVLERLENDGARLQRDWPLDRTSLVVLPAAWGRPLYHAA